MGKVPELSGELLRSFVLGRDVYDGLMVLSVIHMFIWFIVYFVIILLNDLEYCIVLLLCHLFLIFVWVCGDDER